MKIIYMVRYIIIALFGFTAFVSFGALFAGGVSPEFHRWFLAANLLLVIAQGANLVYAYRHKFTNEAIALAVFFCASLGYMFVSYILDYSYAMRALTVGI